MENKTRPPLEGLNHSLSTEGAEMVVVVVGRGLAQGVSSMRGADLTTLPGTAHHALEFCSGFSRSGTQQRHPRQNNMANVVS